MPKARNIYCTCQSLHWFQGHVLPSVLGAYLPQICPSHAVITPVRVLAKGCRRLSPLLAAPAALLLLQGQAKAVLTYNIFESAGDVVVQTSGTLDLTGAAVSRNGSCGSPGAIYSLEALVCTGPNNVSLLIYDITGPASFDGNVSAFGASNVSGISALVQGSILGFGIDPTYNSNTPIVSSATFNGTTLAGLGFTPGLSGLIGTWTLSNRETIQVILGAPAAAVPGPLPLFGAAAAFGWSRKLRKRIAAPLSTPPQS